MDTNRHYFATLAHQKAGQTVALREAARQIRDGMTAAESRSVLMRMIGELEQDVALMGANGVGHA